MNIFINAISIHGGGAFVVLKKLLDEMIVLEPNAQWYIAATPTILSQLPTSNHIQQLPYTWANRSPFHLYYWYESVLPKILRRIKADICFSHTNYLPRRKLSCPSLLLVQHAGHFSAEFERLFLQWKKKYLSAFLWKQKTKWVHDSIKRASTITVQTHALAEAIVKQVGIPKERLAVIPHGSGLLNPVTQARNFPTDSVWRIGYITKFGVQKNFAAAFEAIRLLKNLGMPIKLVLTLNASSPDFVTVSNLIRQYEIEECIENHGEVTHADALTKLYDSLHLFIFPSLCESFGFTLVEAMARGLPVIVADTKSNHEIAGHEANHFQAMNAQALAEKIAELMTKKEMYISAAKHSLEKAKDYCWTNTARHILKELYQLNFIGKS